MKGWVYWRKRDERDEGTILLKIYLPKPFAQELRFPNQNKNKVRMSRRLWELLKKKYRNELEFGIPWRLIRPI